MLDPKRRNLLLVLSLTLMVGIPIWFFLTSVHKKDRLVVSRVALPSVGLLYIAEERGLYEENDLEVDFLAFSTGREALKELDSGKADLATVYQTPILERALENNPLRILTSLHNSNRGTGIVARRDRGIYRPMDLVGRRVGVPLKTSGELFFKGFLQLEGISWSSLKVVNVPPAEFESRFLSGELDAAVMWQPHLHNAQTMLAPNKVSTFYSDVYTEISLLVSNDQVIKSKAPAIKKFLTALTMAEAFLREHPEEAFEILVKSKDFHGQNLDALRASWNVYRLELKLDNFMALTLEKELELRRVKSDRAKSTVEVSDLIRPELLEAVDPEAVTFHPLSRTAVTP